MAKEKESSRRSNTKAPRKNEAAAASKGLRSNGRRQKGNTTAAVKYAAAIVIIVVIIAAAIFASPYILNGQSGSNASFNSFRNNFNSAPRVNIVVAAYNGTVLSGTISCATAIIENIVGSKSLHRNASTIDLSIINQTGCILSHGIGQLNGSNYTVTSLQDCLNLTGTEPALYINYSTKNTTIIRPDYMYVSGDGVFLRECGVASSLTQG